MQITKINEDHWEDLKCVRLESLTDAPHAFGARLQEVKTFSDDRWKHIASDASHLDFFLAYDNSQPIGMAALVNSQTLASMWVNPSFRGKGIGRALVKAIQRYVISASGKQLLLEVETENAEVIGFYEQCGFQLVIGKSYEMCWQP